MPRALRDLQAAMAAHLAGGDAADLPELVQGDSIPAAARLAVHRHHVRHSLVTALEATFPTVVAVVGADFFRRLAGRFVAGALPEQPVLAVYGEGFADFVAAAAPAQSLPYLADVARLDWALGQAARAGTRPPLSAADLAAIPATGLPALQLRPAPGTSLVRSTYPIDRIWSVSQPGAEEGPVALDEGADLLVLPGDNGPVFVRLSPGEARFVESVGEGASLEGAAARAAEADRDFDLSSGFARLLGLGSFAALQH